MAKPDLRAECVRLRVEERLSYKEIERKTGASRGSLSLWLRDHPLTDDEKDDRLAYLKQTRKPRLAPSKFYLVVRGQSMTRSQKARVAEAAVLFRLALHGFIPFGAAFDGEKTDWMVDVGKRIVKVQVKWARPQNSGLPNVSLICVEGHNTRRRYQEGEFDFIVGYDLVADVAYVWSWKEVEKHKRTITVTPDVAERWDKLRT
jgi:transposase-like protein